MWLGCSVIGDQVTKPSSHRQHGNFPLGSRRALCGFQMSASAFGKAGAEGEPRFGQMNGAAGGVGTRPFHLSE